MGAPWEITLLTIFAQNVKLSRKLRREPSGALRLPWACNMRARCVSRSELRCVLCRLELYGWDGGAGEDYLGGVGPNGAVEGPVSRWCRVRTVGVDTGGAGKADCVRRDGDVRASFAGVGLGAAVLLVTELCGRTTGQGMGCLAVHGAAAGC